MKEYQIGEIIEGTIINIRDFGAIMIFNNGKKGLLHISEVANVFIRNIHKYLRIGKTYQVKVIGIEPDGFLKLSMSKISKEEKNEYHKNGVKKVKIDPEFIDYSALKEKLDEWIKKEKENAND
jgi:predicted RNA-binding protein with RPS1 domain